MESGADGVIASAVARCTTARIFVAERLPLAAVTVAVPFASATTDVVGPLAMTTFATDGSLDVQVIGADGSAAPAASRAVAVYRAVSRSEYSESADDAVITTLAAPVGAGGEVEPPVDGAPSLPPAPPHATAVAVNTLTANQFDRRMHISEKETADPWQQPMNPR